MELKSFTTTTTTIHKLKKKSTLNWFGFKVKKIRAQNSFLSHNRKSKLPWVKNIHFLVHFQQK